MPINELFPEEKGYEYSSPMSLVPVRRKVQIPLAPEYWQNELAIPGLPRSVMNDMWLALMSPARAVAGAYTPEEIEQVGLRAGFGIADMGAGMPLTRPPNSLGMFGLWGKKKPPAPSASSAETGSLPSVDKFSNELAAVAEWAKKTTPTKPGLDEPPVGKLEQAYLDEFEQKPWKPDPETAKAAAASEPDAVDSGLEAFNKAYEEAKNYLGASTSVGIGAHPETGEWNWVSLKTGQPIKVPDENTEMAKLMKDVNKAASDYAALFNPKHPNNQPSAPVSEAAWWAELNKLTEASNRVGLQLDFENGHLPLHSETKFIWKDKNGDVAKYGDIPEHLWEMAEKVNNMTAKMPELTSTKKMNHFFGKGSALGKQTVLKQVDSFYPDEYSAWHLQTASGLFKILDYKNAYSGGNTAKLLSPDESIYDFPSMKEAEEFVQGWLDTGHKPWNKSPTFKGEGGSKLLGGEGPSKSSTLKFKPSPVFTEGLEKMDPEQTIREYSPEELDWEYNNEYGKYAKELFPDAFKSREDFQRQYDVAPLRHLTDKELKGLEYATISGVMSKGLKGTPEGERYVMDQVGHRRDVPKIMEGLKNGRTAPPIVLRHDEGMRILGGNTRMMSAIALGKNIPVKVIDIRSFPRKGSHPFDPTPPLTSKEREKNFKRWFAGSKVVDESGEPMVMYHASPSPTIERVDPGVIREKSGGSRDFLSATSSQRFASDWKQHSGPGVTIYPVYISAKNPGDFRNPEHVTQAAAWKALDEVRTMSPSLRNATDREVKRAVATDPEKANLYNKAHKDGLGIAQSGIWSFWEDPKMWKALGWDGAFMKENYDSESPLNFAAPNPSQVKSVFNKGWWNEKDDRILYSSGLPVPIVTEPVDYDPFELEPVAGDPFEQKDDKK